MAAMARTAGDPEPGAAVTHEDFEEGLRRLRAGSLAESAAF
jgi:hypothetical protein